MICFRQGFWWLLDPLAWFWTHFDKNCILKLSLVKGQLKYWVFLFWITFPLEIEERLLLPSPLPCTLFTVNIFKVKLWHKLLFRTTFNESIVNYFILEYESWPGSDGHPQIKNEHVSCILRYLVFYLFDCLRIWRKNIYVLLLLLSMRCQIIYCAVSSTFVLT